jgi:hypothetical protein
MLTILFIELVCFLTAGFTTDATSAHTQRSFSLPRSHSLCLSAILPFAPSSISDIKDYLIVCVDIN